MHLNPSLSILCTSVCMTLQTCKDTMLTHMLLSPFSYFQIDTQVSYFLPTLRCTSSHNPRVFSPHFGDHCPKYWSRYLSWAPRPFLVCPTNVTLSHPGLQPHWATEAIIILWSLSDQIFAFAFHLCNTVCRQSALTPSILTWCSLFFILQDTPHM